jgi:hypothetical protein
MKKWKSRERVGNQENRACRLGATREGGRLGGPAVGLSRLGKQNLLYEQQIVKPVVVGTAGAYEWSDGLFRWGTLWG